MLCWILAGAGACGEPTVPPSGTAVTNEFDVRLEPPYSTAAASPVTRLVVEPVPGDLGSVGLFRDPLSAYHLGRVASGDLPGTLLERQIPVQSWRAGDEFVVAPELILESGELYSLAHAGGLLVEFTVGDSAESPKTLRRIWPPSGSGGEPRAIYCGGAVEGEIEEEVALEPGGVRASVTRGVAPGLREDECLTLEAREPQTFGAVLQPPITVGTVAIDPAPWIVAAVGEPRDGPCTADEAPIGPGCAQIADDRIEIEPAEAPRFWALLGGRLAYAGSVADVPVVAKGLEPGSRNLIEVTVYDEAARRWSGELAIVAALPTSHVVINEVLANPVGAEPSQEWVELQNDGDDVVELEDWTLEDTGLRFTLPRCALEPGRFALVVEEDYDESSPFDVPPAAGAAVLRVESLGHGGLRNTGEPLILRNPDGIVRSSFPAVGGAPEGFSVARKEPWAPDVSESFAKHAEPGASPGAVNVVF